MHLYFLNSVNFYLHLHLNSSAHTSIDTVFFPFFHVFYFMYHQGLIYVHFTPSDSRLVLFFFDAHTFFLFDLYILYIVALRKNKKEVVAMYAT